MMFSSSARILVERLKDGFIEASEITDLKDDKAPLISLA